MNESIHSGHRQRMRTKLMKNQSKQMLEHELLEVLLFYAQPRKNTNEIAHLLLKEFGTIKNVFNADAKDLMLVKGVSEHIAAFLKLFVELFDLYNNTLHVPMMNISNIKNLKTYIGPVVKNAVDETLYIVFADEKCDAFAYEQIKKGNAMQIQTSLEEIVTAVQRKSAKFVALAHNHPYGECHPSQSDIISTLKIKFILQILGVELLEHIVFGNDGYCGFIDLVNDEYAKILEHLDFRSKNFIGVYRLPIFNDVDDFEDK